MLAFHSKVAAFAVVCLLLVLQANAYTMENMCAQWSGQGYIGNPTDCTKWGYCKNNQLISYGTCGENLVFDSASSTCQYATKMACSTSVAQTCKVLTTAGFMADPNDCTKYAYCFGNGKSEIKSCPTGQNYAANNNTCVWGPTCPQDTICRFMPNNIYVGDPTNCGRYLQCNNGYGLSGQCPGNRFFNAATGTCDTTNPCTGDGGSNVDPDSITLSPSPTACANVTAGTKFVGDSTTCYGFYSCEATNPGSWGSCPFGTVYNSEENCVSPASIACPYNRCLNTNMTYAAVAYSGCTKYTYCPNGSVGQCPPGFLYFDELFQKCVPTQPEYKICTVPRP